MLRLLLLAALAALSAASEEAALEKFANMPHRHKMVRPVAHDGDSVTVAVELTLVDVDVHEKDNSATLTGWVSLRWKDASLAFSGAVNKTRAHPADIWTPDILPFNAVSPAGKPWLRQVPAIVRSTGEIHYVPPGTITVRCQRTVTAETDRFVCPFKLGSWTHSHEELNLVAEKDHVDLSEMIANGHWAVESTKVTRQEKIYDCCPDKYDSIDVKIVLKPQHA